MKKINKNQSGIALLLTMIILSAGLSIAMLIAAIVVIQFKLSSDINYSMIAVYAADSGAEWQLYQIRNGASVPVPTMSNGASISTTIIGSYPNFTIKSLGAYKEVRRQFEINF